MAFAAGPKTSIGTWPPKNLSAAFSSGLSYAAGADGKICASVNALASLSALSMYLITSNAFCGSAAFLVMARNEPPKFAGPLGVGASRHLPALVFTADLMSRATQAAPMWVGIVPWSRPAFQSGLPLGVLPSIFIVIALTEVSHALRMWSWSPMNLLSLEMYRSVPWPTTMS
ncbi:hypothetical protein OHA18_00520 [Kribbella sp. NBC_00709]|nr:hypothetical protein [Kribbella sp. NBC_00709]